MADQAHRPSARRRSAPKSPAPARADRERAGAVHLLLELIAGAEQHQDADVHVQSRRDGDAVRDALTDAARRGVEVKLLIDGFGSAATPDFFTELAQAGGQYCVFNPS